MAVKLRWRHKGAGKTHEALWAVNSCSFIAFTGGGSRIRRELIREQIYSPVPSVDCQCLAGLKNIRRFIRGYVCVHFKWG